MALERFQAKRASGKSAAQVVVDLVCGADPGTTFTYQEIIDALDEGSDRRHTRREAYMTVAQANHRLLRDHRRVLRVVRNVGYMLAHAREHAMVADARSRRGNRQFRWALQTMENARLEEMTEQQRAIHLAQTTIANQLFLTTDRIQRQQRAQAAVIANLTSRLDQAGL